MLGKKTCQSSFGGFVLRTLPSRALTVSRSMTPFLKHSTFGLDESFRRPGVWVGGLVGGLERLLAQRQRKKRKGGGLSGRKGREKGVITIVQILIRCPRTRSESLQPDGQVRRLGRCM